MRIAITGTTGRVGRALADRFCGVHEVIELPRARLDLSDRNCGGILDDLEFDLLLNPAGLTGLEQCEDEPELAARVNAGAPGELARVCRRRRAPILHFSTDYVFDGSRAGWRTEEEPARPISVYGESKLAGETAVLGEGGTVMRVSWVFGPERAAFPDMIVSRALAGEPLAAIADKFSLPAYTADIGEWVARWLDAGCPGGIFHGCNSGEPVSWHGMATEIARYLAERGIVAGPIEALSLNEMAAFRAQRPRHSAMATPRLAELSGKPPRPWQDALREHLASLLISR